MAEEEVLAQMSSGISDAGAAVERAGEMKNITENKHGEVYGRLLKY